MAEHHSDLRKLFSLLNDLRRLPISAPNRYSLSKAIHQEQNRLRKSGISQYAIDNLIHDRLACFASTGIEERHEAQAKTPIAKQCPKCGASLVLRTAKNGSNVGKQFFGCSQFPQCKTVVPIG